MREERERWRAEVEPATIEDWAEVQEIERDILLLYHQLTEYETIMGDLYYGTVYRLPYWEYVNPAGLEGEQQRLVREGCLVMILAMAWDRIDGSGAYIDEHIDACRAGIATVKCDDADMKQLVNTVQNALDLAERARRESQDRLQGGAQGGEKEQRTRCESVIPEEDELVRLSRWVHQRYVRGYYQEMARRYGKPYHR